MLALASALQFLESLIPLPLPLGVKAGISSVVIMYVLLFMDFRSALTVAVLKSVFVFTIRGASAFFMSVCGGILSVVIMGTYLFISRKRSGSTGILILSVSGGISHNAGQLAAAAVISGNAYTLSYLPVLLIAGIISGIFTGTLLRIILPRLKITSSHSYEGSYRQNEKT